KGPGKIIEEMKRSRIAMRLEDRKDAAEIAGLRRAQRGADLGWMMCVVVNDGDAVTRFDLEPPVDSAETLKRARNDARFNAHVPRGCERSSGIENVVHAGHVQLKVLRAAAIEPQRKRGTEAFEVDAGNANVGGSRRAVGDNAPLDQRDQRLHGRFVDAE